jgi:putative DNA primase/helicase
MAATETYRVESDAFARFLDECCVIDPNAKATSAALYSAYKSWAESNGESPLTSKKIGELLRDDPESRFRPDRTKAVRSWLGIGLLSQPTFRWPDDGQRRILRDLAVA